MITLEEGSKDMLPWVKVDIEPGRWPFTWWFEVRYYDPNHMVEGKKAPCWSHWVEKDGGAIGFWRAWKKAQKAAEEVWYELIITEGKTVAFSSTINPSNL